MQNKPASAPTADQILDEMMAGNARFASGQALSPRRQPEDYRRLAEGQKPNAIVLGCADSRVPPELIFDQGVGDLFVIRIAGNTISGTGYVVKGSLEYAIAEFNVPLIFVLGHSSCGAVTAAIKQTDEKERFPGSINGLVHLVKPAVTRAHGEQGNELDNAIRANVQIGMDRIRKQPPIIQPLVKEGRVKVVGGIYDLRTGKVTLVP
jgi:carbonic anhydrase